jgi:hypothetical protein
MFYMRRRKKEKVRTCICTYLVDKFLVRRVGLLKCPKKEERWVGLGWDEVKVECVVGIMFGT